MDIKELKTQSKEELTKTLNESREEVGILKFKLGSGQLKQHQKLKQTKKLIARILTVLKTK